MGKAIHLLGPPFSYLKNRDTHTHLVGSTVSDTMHAKDLRQAREVGAPQERPLMLPPALRSPAEFVLTQAGKKETQLLPQVARCPGRGRQERDYSWGVLRT